MTQSVLMAIDQGTTSSRAILFSLSGDILHSVQKEVELFYPEEGWVEQDAAQIWDDILAACNSCFDYANANDVKIESIGITNQRETSVIWDKETGVPIYNAIVWQDRRTKDFCTDLKEQELEAQITDKTGLLLDPYFSATKVKWMLDKVDGARAKAKSGSLLFGTMDSFILWHLSGRAVHKTDITNASRTMLYNVLEDQWDQDLLDIFDVPIAMLPDVKANTHDFGVTSKNIFEREIMIGGMAGDQQAALIGQGCFDVGMVKSTYGTGCFALMNIGGHFKVSENRLLTSPAYHIGDQKAFMIEGSIFVAGAAVQWLRDGLGFFEDAAESEALAQSVPHNGRVVCVPAFTGLGAPHWDADARGIITGIGRDTTKAHITRAVLEAQAYQTLDLIQAMENDGGRDAEVIRMDGGLARNGFVCQFLADMLDKPVEVPKITEATAWGAACLAGLQAGVFKGLSDVANVWALDKRYEPNMDEDERAMLYNHWRKSINMLLG